MIVWWPGVAHLVYQRFNMMPATLRYEWSCTTPFTPPIEVATPFSLYLTANF